MAHKHSVLNQRHAAVRFLAPTGLGLCSCWSGLVQFIA
jgi:hypothetical protein